MFGVFCFVTLFSTTIAAFTFNFDRSNSPIINYLKIFLVIVFLLFSIFNVFIGIYWILDFNNDWSTFLRIVLEGFYTKNPSIKTTPIRFYLFYIVPYVFLLNGIFTTLDFRKNLKKFFN